MTDSRPGFFGRQPMKKYLENHQSKNQTEAGAAIAAAACLTAPGHLPEVADSPPHQCDGHYDDPHI